MMLVHHQQAMFFFTQDAWESLHLLTGSASVLDTLGHTRTLFGRLFSKNADQPNN